MKDEKQTEADAETRRSGDTETRVKESLSSPDVAASPFPGVGSFIFILQPSSFTFSGRGSSRQHVTGLGPWSEEARWSSRPDQRARMKDEG